MAGSNFQMASSPEVLLPPVKVDTRSGTLSERESNSVWKRAIVSSLAVFLLLAVVTTGIVAVAGAGPTCSVATGSGQVGRSLAECSFNSLTDYKPEFKLVRGKEVFLAQQPEKLKLLKLESFKTNLDKMIMLNVPDQGRNVKVTRECVYSSSGSKGSSLAGLETMLRTHAHAKCESVDLSEFLNWFRPVETRFFSWSSTEPTFGTCFEASSMLRYIYDSKTLLDEGVEVSYEFEGGTSKNQLWKASKSNTDGPHLRIVYKVEVAGTATRLRQ